jgi:AraC-like DNA-binding protein
MGASVKEVVFLMEFKSISYYNYSFKKKTGVTPVDFKKLYIE